MKAASLFPQLESAHSSYKLFSSLQHKAKRAILNHQQTCQDVPTAEHVPNHFTAGAKRHMNSESSLRTVQCSIHMDPAPCLGHPL